MSTWYQYDSVEKDVLIRLVEDNRYHEILHKGDKAWRALYPQPDDKDELYTRAIWLGEGCWDYLDDITEQEAEKILKDWGYTELPPGDPEAVQGIPAASHTDALLLFQGKLKKVKIVSNNICYGPCPNPGDEVEQHLTISSDGEALLTRYSYNEEIIEETRLHMDPENTKKILGNFEKSFSVAHEDCFVTDIGSWDVVLTNEEGREFSYSGSLMEQEESAVYGFSDMLREVTGRDDLLAFDGNPDRINDLILEYTRESKIKLKSLPEGAEYEFITWNYVNKIAIDRKTETLVNHIQFAESASVTNTYQIEGGVSNLLDGLWLEMFDDIEGNPEDVVDDPMEQRHYKLTFHTKQGMEKTIEGSYDKNSLPSEWPDFIEKIYRFICFYGIGEIFEEKYYDKAKRRKSDYIFCDVEFEPGGKTYCYLVEDDSYEVGDTVLVPAGPDNHEALVRIVDKNYYSKEDAPFPVEKAKWIIKRIDEDEIDEYLNKD